MYHVDGKDSVAELIDVPRPDVGAPSPMIVCDEAHLLLAYLVNEQHCAWESDSVLNLSGETGEHIAIVTLHHPTAHMFGLPNDETLSGHPLYSRGLRWYSVWEVQASSWIHQFERVNAVHEQHSPQRFLANKRHFIFTFHDSTFECIAHGFTYKVVRASFSDAIMKMAETLHQGWMSP